MGRRLIGGRVRRAATLADGWMPLFLTASEYGDAVERLAKEVDRAAGGGLGDPGHGALRLGGRRPADCAAPWLDLDVLAYGIPARAFERHLVAGRRRTWPAP